MTTETRTRCARKYCSNFAVIIIEPDIPVCGEHDELEKITNGGFICKHCGVKIVSRYNLRPIYGKSHKRNCPRRRMYG